MTRRSYWGNSLFFLAAALLCYCSLYAQPSPLPLVGDSFPTEFSARERTQFERGLNELNEKLSRLRSNALSSQDLNILDSFADAALYQKGIVWGLRYETNLTTADLALFKSSLERGHERAEALLANQPRWTRLKGRVLRGYVSAVDGSTQPYGVIVPANYDAVKPIRLDVVLHGSMRSSGLNELRFGAQFDKGDEEEKAPPESEFIELHPLGRVENCYRWAGETDVSEAIESACRNYKIDRNRIVLRGMSMGASGTWHLGLKYPSDFVALGPYAGYVDTHRFSAMPFPNFIKVGPLPPVQEQSLHMLDSIDYAANAGVVPVIAAMGEKDMGFDNHIFMEEAMAREGLQLVNLVSAGTGHVVDPVTHREQMRRIAEIAGKGVDRGLPDLRFVTWTLKYNRCHWIELLALKEHYQRAEIAAHLSADGSVDIDEPINITEFAIHPPALQKENSKLRIGAAQIALPARKNDDLSRGVVLSKKGGRWKFAGTRDSFVSAGKRPRLQGPMDDAFTTPFLCVRGTGRAWNTQIASWADANLRRFAYEWARYLRGDLPIKNDTEVTLEDLRTKNLILFGDPGNNSWIWKALPNLPITWTREEVAIGGKSGPAKDHAPALICANPLSGANGHYVVLNSGHTFHEKELSSFNYLLFPHLGDWALIHVWPGAENWRPGTSMFPEDIVQAGFFNERWHLPNSDSSSAD